VPLGQKPLSLSHRYANESKLLQEDGKKTVQLKPNCLFEHEKTVMYQIDSNLFENFTLCCLLAIQMLQNSYSQVGAVVVGLDQYINYYKLQ
jgi:hypothetical protein